MKSKIKFVIASPRQKDGGPIALHTLCKCMQEAGYSAKIFLYDTETFVPSTGKAESVCRKKWIMRMLKQVCFFICGIINRVFGTKLYEDRTIRSIKGCRHYLRTRVDDHTIVVYPESLHGNPLHAKNVVHWLLYYYDPPAWGYGRNDLFIAYREQFNNEKFNPEGYTVLVSHYDLDLYKRTNFGEREGNCYVIRKGAKRDDLPKKFDGPVIDSLSEPEKVACFNRCKYCISYDLQTAYSGIAALCGCISVVVPEPGKSKADCRKPGEARCGVAFGFDEDEIARAIATREYVLDQYKAINEYGKQSAKRFAEICTKHFFGESID